MKKMTTFPTWIALAVLLILCTVNQSFALVSEKEADLIEDTCKITLDYDLCMASLKSDPRSTSADVKGLARIMLEVSMTYANNTIAIVQKLINGATDPVVKNALQFCSVDYRGAVIDGFPNAIKYLDLNSYEEAISMADKAASVGVGCESSFRPIRGRNNIIVHLTRIAESIMSTLR